MVPSRLSTFWSARLVAGAVTSVLVAGPLAASTAVAVPANNGTIKVHSVGTALDEHANEPKQVCAFYLAGFGYDGDQVVSYAFATQPGGVATGPTGSFTVGPDNGRPDGSGRSSDLALPNGMYKVTATSSDGDKTKVFKVECAPSTPVGDEIEGTPTGPADPTPVPPTPTPVPTPIPAPDGQGQTNSNGDSDPTPAGLPDGPTAPEVDGVVDILVLDEDSGTAPLGGVQTGGGATAPGAGSGGAAVLPGLLGLVAAGLAASVAVRRRSAH